jgi:hypothetical protein
MLAGGRACGRDVTRDVRVLRLRLSATERNR